MRRVAEPMAFDAVRAFGLTLAGTEATTAYGSPALKVNGHMYACIAVNKSAEPDTLVVRVPLEQRDHLLSEQPDVYYLTEHYAGHPFVLVRLGRVRRDALEALLYTAHRLSAAEKRRPIQRRPRR
jgi:hypothetical protein